MKTTLSRLVSPFLLAALAALPLQANVLERILVKVNGEILTKTDLEQRQIAFLRQEQNLQVSEEALNSDAELRKILLEVTPGIVAEAIDEMLLVQRGRDLGYRMGDDQYRSILENIKKENNITSEEQFQAALAQEGLTMADLRRMLERQMLISRVTQQEVMQRISITDEEARAYHARHGDELVGPASVTLREILIAVPAATVQGQAAVNVGLEEEARERAEEIRARALAGEDFAALAAELSDAPSKANGGLIGPLRRDELSAVVRQAVADLEPGGIAEPIRTPMGYQLLKLEAATDAAPPAFEQVRDRIAERIFEEKRQAEFDKFLKKLREQAIMEWKSDELRRAWEQHVAAARPADSTL